MEIGQDFSECPISQTTIASLCLVSVPDVFLSSDLLPISLPPLRVPLLELGSFLENLNFFPESPTN
jgi:hypothetical protein